MIADRTFKQGDLEPALDATLKQRSNTSVIDLSAAIRVEVRIKERRGRRTVVGDCVIVNATGGRVRYLWLEGDTDVLGEYDVVFVIYWAVGRPQTVPSNGYKELIIEKQLR